MSQPVPLCSHVMTHRNGKTCGVPALRGRTYCYHHDPSRAECKPVRAFAASIQPLDSITAMQNVLNGTIRHLLQGKIDSRRARQVISATNSAIRAYHSRLLELGFTTRPTRHSSAPLDSPAPAPLSCDAVNNLSDDKLQSLVSALHS